LRLSQKETRICGLGKVRGLKRAVSGSLKVENVFANWEPFDARVSASQHQVWKSFRENRNALPRSHCPQLSYNMFIHALQWICPFSEFLKMQKMSKKKRVGQLGAHSKIFNTAKELETDAAPKITKENAYYRVSFARPDGSSQFDPLNLLRGN
jgi:hypothetical protein